MSATETPQMPTIVVYPSEKKGKYYNNNIFNSGNSFVQKNTMKVKSVENAFSYNETKIRVNRDYDPGWFDGNMEIYIKYKYRPKFGGLWSGWNETATVDDIDEDKEETFNKSLGNFTQPYIFLIQMWEEDTFSDDIVCNESYHEVRDQYDNTNLNTTEIYNDYGGTDRRLTDHDTSHWSKIWIVQSSM